MADDRTPWSRVYYKRPSEKSKLHAPAINDCESTTMAEGNLKIDTGYQIPDDLWERIEPMLPAPKPKKKPGRPRMEDRKAMAAILYVLDTGCCWKHLPRSLGAPSTVHDRFQEWRRAGVFQRLRQAGVIEPDGIN